jgi:hypothetical protein
MKRKGPLRFLEKKCDQICTKQYSWVILQPCQFIQKSTEKIPYLPCGHQCKENKEVMFKHN